MNSLKNFFDDHVGNPCEHGNRDDTAVLVELVEEERPVGLEAFRSGTALGFRNASGTVNLESDEHTEQGGESAEACEDKRIHVGTGMDDASLGSTDDRSEGFAEHLDAEGIGPEVTGEDSAESENHHRDKHASRSFVDMFFTFLGAAIAAEEREDNETTHVDGSDHSGKETDHVEGRAHRAAREQAFEDQVLGPETGKAREADNREERENHDASRNRSLLEHAAHLAHVLFAGQCVNHGTGTEEEGCLEEGVGKHVEDRSVEGANACSHEHVAELANRGVSENLLDIVLEEAGHCGPESREEANQSNNEEHHRQEGEHVAHTSEEVHATGHHGCSMDEGRNRCRTGHGIREPSEERNLSGLTRAADKEQEAGKGENREDDFHVAASNKHLDEGVEGIVVQDFGAAHRDEAKHTEKEPDIAHAVHDEGLVCSLAVVVVVVPETDEEVGAEAHAFPTEEREEQAVGEHEHDHAEQEQVDVGEEAGKTAIPVHVTDGVQRDEGANAGNEQKHDAGKAIEQESDIHLEERNIDPVTERGADTFSRHAPSEENHACECEHREKHGEEPDNPFGGALLRAGRNHGNGTEEDSPDKREERNKPKR